MLSLLLLSCFHIFVNSTHNVSPQKEVANVWHTKESEANVGIWSLTRYATYKNWNKFLYVLIPCTNITYMCCTMCC